MGPPCIWMFYGIAWILVVVLARKEILFDSDVWLKRVIESEGWHPDQISHKQKKRSKKRASLLIAMENEFVKSETVVTLSHSVRKSNLYTPNIQNLMKSTNAWEPIADIKLLFLCIKANGIPNNKERQITFPIPKFCKLKWINTCGTTMII